MKFIRIILNLLLLAAVLVALLVAAAFAPPVQTWVAEMELARLPGVQVTLGELSARFGTLAVTDLHLETKDAVLTLPSLEVGLPLTTALWKRQILVRSLVAKGWILDLSRRPEAPDAPAQDTPGIKTAEGASTAAPVEVSPTQEALQVLGGILGGWSLPFDLSLDGVELEGDVLLAAAPGRPPPKVHVTIKGGGVSAGSEGALAIDAATAFLDTKRQVVDFAARGRLGVTMESPRTLKRAGIKADLSVKAGSLPEDFSVSVNLAAARGAGEETLTLDLSRGKRLAASLVAHVPAAAGRLMGTWKIDLRDADVAPFTPDHPLLAFAATGQGDFDTDPAFKRVHAAGRLNIVGSRLGVLAPPLEHVGTLTLDTGFDLAHSGRSLRVDRLSISVAGTGPAAVVQSLQPFDVDERTGAVAVADPNSDWLEAAINGFPLRWLSGVTGGVTFAAGEAAGGFLVRARNSGIALQPKTPLTATGVSVLYSGKMLGQGLDLSLSLQADFTPQGWQLQWAPGTVSSAGRRLVSSEGKSSRTAEAGRPVEFAATWDIDLAALAAQTAIPGLGWITARSATGDFSASFGTSTRMDGKVAVIGPDHSVTANVHADVGGSGAVVFRAPVKIAYGSSVSDVAVDGRWSGGRTGSRVDLRLVSSEVTLEHLRALAVPAAMLAGAPLTAVALAGKGGAPAPPSGRDQRPFWGDWVGRVTIGFDRLKAADGDFGDVHGSFDVDRQSIRVENARYGLADHGRATVDGTLAFDPAAESPYRLKATLGLGEVDGASLFAPPAPGQEPVFKGRFSVASTLTGYGLNLADLIARTQQEFRLTSKGGIIRLLKTNVAESIPDQSKPVANVLGTVGSLMGPLFGVNRSSIASGVIHLNKKTEAVLDFSYQIAEIGFDQLAITARRGADRTIHLDEIAMSGREERVTGTGQITYVKGLPLSAMPLSVDLRLSVRGAMAELSSTGGLVTSAKDDQGYTMLIGQPMHFGGTLLHIDDREWHDLLVKEAIPKPEGGKKDGPAAAGKK